MPKEKMPQVSDKELMMSNTLMIQPEYREEFLMELREILPQGFSADLDDIPPSCR